MAMATAEDQQQGPRDAQKAPDELFRYSTWVHVGAGAEGCDEGETGSCGNPLHFHAWCRLPNQLQHQDIRERALAAKARRVRQLKDPESDAHVVLEADMVELLEIADPTDMVSELVNREWWKRQIEAMQDVEELDEFKTVERDRERMAELRAMDGDARPRDEYDELERHLSAYNERVKARVEEAERPLREATEALSREELVAQIRAERISSEATQAFMETFSKWEWLAGTFNRREQPRTPVWADASQLTEVAPEVIDAVRAAFADLESSLQRGPKGN